MADEAKSGGRPYFGGIILLFVAAVLWSLNGALIKLTHDDGRGPHAVTIAFYRSLFAGIVLIPLVRGKFHTLRRRSRGAAEVDSGTRRGVGGIVSTLLRLRPAAICCVVFFTLMTVSFVLANVKTEAANAIILQYTSTFWVFGLSPWVLREKPQTRDLWILGLAMIGIVFIFAGNAATDAVGLVIAMSSGLFFALLTLMIRRMKDSDSAAVTVLNNIGSAILLLPAVLLVGSLAVSARSCVLLVMLGVVQFGLPYYLYTLGLVRVAAYQAALITLAEPVLVPVWTYLAVKETVHWTTVAGGLLILLALLAFVRTAARAPRPGIGGASP
jgi:drug/metabolite transporter (DMT)-like permease